jgi:hypothetical protein
VCQNAANPQRINRKDWASTVVPSYPFIARPVEPLCLALYHVRHSDVAIVHNGRQPHPRFACDCRRVVLTSSCPSITWPISNPQLNRVNTQTTASPRNSSVQHNAGDAEIVVSYQTVLPIQSKPHNLTLHPHLSSSRFWHSVLHVGLTLFHTLLMTDDIMQTNFFASNSP